MSGTMLAQLGHRLVLVGTRKLAVAEERVSRLLGERTNLSDQLSDVVSRCEAVEGEREGLEERAGQVEAELRDTQATLEASECLLFLSLCTWSCF